MWNFDDNADGRIYCPRWASTFLNFPTHTTNRSFYSSVGETLEVVRRPNVYLQNKARATRNNKIRIVFFSARLLLGGSVVTALDSGPRGREFDSRRLRFRSARSTQPSNPPGLVNRVPACRRGAFTCRVAGNTEIPYGR